MTWIAVAVAIAVIVAVVWGAASRTRRRDAATRDALAALRRMRDAAPDHQANRRTFDEQVAVQLAHAKPFAVLALDIDQFAAVNERIGSANGDILLQQVGERLRRALADKNGAAHVFSDIFAILAEGHPRPEDPEALALHLLRACEAPFICGGAPVTITASIGIARAPANGDTAEALLTAAARALRTTKAGGPGRWGFYNDGAEPT